MKDTASRNVDYLIVGQGIAGSVLTHTLLQYNKTVCVIDEGKTSTASRIAAGLCNPIVFKRLTPSWMVNETLPLAKDFYHEQELLLKQHFFTDIPLYKLFKDDQEQKLWKEKSNDAALYDWINPEIEFPFNNEIKCPYGAGKVLQAGFLNTEKWLDAYKEYLIEKELLVIKKLDYTNLTMTEHGVRWDAISAKKIIFCEGYRTVQNPYFDWLPFKLTKGEVLNVQLNDVVLNGGINKGVFILPQEIQGSYKLGATYDWDNINETPTKRGKEELRKKASVFINTPIKVNNHMAGVRPTVKDRKPLLGLHPQNHHLTVFNGLGTKGVMLAPYFAKKMADLLTENIPLPEDVDINRWKNLL